jgi:AraC-like DNA-binding protein
MKSPIPVLQSFTELNRFTGFERTPLSDDFEIVTHEETYPGGVKKMIPPHRRNFFTVILLNNQQEGQMRMNEAEYEHQENVLFFQSPEHIFSFVRGRAMTGYIVFFRKEFLFRFVDDPVESFPFFSSLQNNLFQLDPDQMARFREMFSLLYKEKGESSAPYLLMAILEKAMILHKKHQSIEEAVPGEYSLVIRFKRLVEANYIEHRGLEFYAERLNLSTKYLSERIKAHTGKTAKAHITERVLLEAKNLLLYSDMDIAEISHSLEFTEPSYFGKFFRKHTGTTPKNFRLNR